MEHPIQWTAPSPCWRALAGDSRTPASSSFRQPALLRFGADTFMDDFMAMLDVEPRRLEEFRARPETWRGPLGAVVPPAPPPSFARKLHRKRLAGQREPQAVRTNASATPVLKLYQPAHQRYYLIAGSLVCRLPGLPDRTVDAARQERVTFVLRRLLPKPGVKTTVPDLATWDEHAFVSGGWRTISLTGNDTAARLDPGEEQLPMFPAGYLDDEERRRKVFAGLVPVGRREGYLGAPPQPAPAASSGVSFSGAAPLPTDPRMSLLQKQVTEPWKQLIARAAMLEAQLRTARDETPVPNQTTRERTRREGRELIQTVSWYVLLDLAKFLEDHIPNVWAELSGQRPSLSSAELSLVRLLDSGLYTRDGSPRSMRSALVAIRPLEAQLENVTSTYTESTSGWPSVRFALATIRSTEETKPIGSETPPAPVERLAGIDPSTLEERIKAALPAVATAPMPDTPLAARPVLAPDDPGWFLIRCVYERPNCGRLSPPVVSEPTQIFQLAGFFDPDAPARPIRIGLPLDVSPAGLRKFDKNTAFMVSDMLCGHVQRMKALTLGDLVLSVLPWPFHKDLPVPAGGPCSSGGASIGMMCSLSIPIVTICALILLMIIVGLLDFVFRWIPYFLVCFPIPNFKGKETA